MKNIQENTIEYEPKIFFKKSKAGQLLNKVNEIKFV
jgi:hypothetical protein